MAAATILENSDSLDFQVHIFDKNKTPGNKVIISGGGRCNVTTGITDKKILLTKYTRGADFIKKAFGKFSPKKCREWFESHGVPLKCESDNRVFPVSDD
jgi:predicted flavoprotein YhiN